MSKLKRPVHEMPDFVRKALEEAGVLMYYEARPPYQRNDYIGWIMKGKREETRMKRLRQMIDELKIGNVYMGMAYRSKNSD